MDRPPRASSAPSPGPAQLSRAVFFVAMAMGSIAVAVVVGAVSYLPTNDGPQHVLAGFLQKTFSEPGTPYSAVLEPLPAFAERGFTLLFVPLLEVLSWRTALRLTLVVVVLSGAWAFAALACALSKRRSPWALFGFALAFPWTLYMGFLPFVVASNAGLAAIAYAVSRERDEPRPIELVSLSAMLLLEAVMHVGAATTTGLVVLSVLVARAPAGRRSRALGITALVGLPAAAVLFAVLLTSSRTPAAAEPWVWTARGEWLVELPRYFVPGPMMRALVGCLLGGLGLFVGARRVVRHEASRTELGVLAAALVFVLSALFGPLDLPGWQLVAPRFAALALPLAVVLLAALPEARPRATIAVVAALTATSLVVTHHLHRRLARGCEPALAGLDARVSLAGSTLPMALDTYCGVSPDPRTSEVPHLAPLFHVGALYAVAHGGLTPYMFGGSSAVHPFRYRPDAPRPPSPAPELYIALGGDEGRNDHDKREFLVARFGEYGLAHDHLLVVGAREGELASILARGYVADWQSESAMIAHPRPCPLDVIIRATDAGRSRLRVEIGQRPRGGILLSSGAERGEELPDGARRLTFASGGCGPVWVRGYLDADSSGTASPGDVFCAGAGRDGSLDVDLVTPPSPAAVQCRIERRGPK